MGKRGILILGCAGFLLGGVWLIRWTERAPAAKPTAEIAASSEADRLAFLQAEGFSDCRLLSTEEIQLPTAADGAYADYAALQETQHLPLSAHFGESVTQYTYAQSSAAQDTLRVELLVDENQMLVGAMQYDVETRAMQAILLD